MFLFVSEFALFVIMAAFFVAFLVLFAAAMIATVYFVKRKQKRDGKIWAATAARLGLQIRPFAFEMVRGLGRMRGRMGLDVNTKAVSTVQPIYGIFCGRAVEIFIRQRRISYYEDKYGLYRIKHLTCCETAIENRKNLSFLIVGRNYSNFINRSLGGGSRPQTGLPRFDENFIVFGDDLRPIRDLLCTRVGEGGSALAETFAAHLNRAWIVEASEEKIAIKFPGMVLDAARLSAALQAATDLARHLEAALRRI
jgi:hypothetical protein